MTERHAGGNRQPLQNAAIIPWTNISGELIPPYGVVQLRTNRTTITQASKPSSTEGLFYTNGPVSVAASARGESRVWDRPQQVILDGNPSVGDEVGPTAGSWEMSPSGTGFRVLRQANADRIGLVVQVGGGAGGTHEILFYIVGVYCPDEYSTDPCDRFYVEVVWTHYTGGCGKTPPGVDDYTGFIRVYDNGGILEFYTADQLLNGTHVSDDGSIGSGLKGRATYWYPREDSSCSYGCEPLWIIDSLIGNPECNDLDVTDVGTNS